MGKKNMAIIPEDNVSLKDFKENIIFVLSGGKKNL